MSEPGNTVPSVPGNVFNPPDRTMAQITKVSGSASGSVLTGPILDTDANPEAVSIRLLGPWLIAEFRTPALPGVVLDANGTNRELTADEAALLRDEAVRCGFNVGSTGLGDEFVADDVEESK